MCPKEKSDKPNGGDMLIAGLANEGVEYIFGIIGEQLCPVMDAMCRMSDEKGIHSISVRNEQGAGFMADAYARVSGKPGVCYGTLGPGLTNLISGIDAAWADNIPLLVFASQNGPKFEDYNPLQGGIDQMALLRPFTKYEKSISDPNRVLWGLQKCFRELTSGRPGPVFLELTEDALYGEVTFGDKILAPFQYRCLERPMGALSEVQKAIDLLLGAQKPLIISGGGVSQSGAWPQLQSLSLKYHIPVITTVMGIGTMSTNHETYIGASLLQAGPLKAVHEADVILVLGMKFSNTMAHGKAPIWNDQAKIIQIDIDPQMIGKNIPVEVGIVGDCGKVLDQITTLLDQRSDSTGHENEWIEWVSALRTSREQGIQMDTGKINSAKSPLTPQRLLKELYEFINPDDILAIDGGDIALFATSMVDYFKPHEPRSTLWGVGMGHLGTCIPYAMGAELAKPNSRSFTITGDGAFLFNIQELDTAMHYKIPFVCIIANNNSWGMIKNVQKNSFQKRYYDTDLPDTDYVSIAKGFGCFAERVENPDEIKNALQRAVESNLPAILDIPIEFVLPPLGNFKKILKSIPF